MSPGENAARRVVKIEEAEEIRRGCWLRFVEHVKTCSRCQPEAGRAIDDDLCVLGRDAFRRWESFDRHVLKLAGVGS